MNNKGFAITGILYTIFILFIMVLLSILSGLSSRRSLLEKSIMSLEDDYKITDVNGSNIASGTTTAPFTGKYIFKIKNSESECTAYLKKGTSLENLNSINFIESSCNSNKTNLVVSEGYKFNNGEE